MRKIEFVNGEKYHIFNRGVDKRNIFTTLGELERFFECMTVFNSTELTGSLYERRFQKQKQKQKHKQKHKPLVNFIAYNLLSNHFHFILEQVVENGISKFMKRLQGGYSYFFNLKNKRSGSLFQGPFKAKLIDNNEYLLHLSAYVNLNDKISPLGDLVTKWGKSSWKEYVDEKFSQKICPKKHIVLDQFRSRKEYGEFALSSLEDIRINKEKYKELEE